VFDAGTVPEIFLEKIIKEKPDNIIIIDAAAFGGKAGECRILEEKDLKTVNLFSTHNASLTLAINYLQNNLRADIITLIIQPKSVSLGEKLSPEIEEALIELEDCFYESS
ncbi:MAG: hydrogenase maturation protease, partial [Candidatus Omnitrophota bacterium]